MRKKNIRLSKSNAQKLLDRLFEKALPSHRVVINKHYETSCGGSQEVTEAMIGELAEVVRIYHQNAILESD